jgi:putative ABC transport system permease protein
MRIFLCVLQSAGTLLDLHRQIARGHMLQDYKLGFRMLLKYPGLTIAGTLALAIAIAIGAGWYDLSHELFSPTIPLPEGDRLVSIDTQNILTNELELRVARDFLEWRRELRTIEDLGAFRPAPRNLIVNAGVPARIHMAEVTAAVFRAARVSPLLGRALLESDEVPGAPGVVVLGYDVWQQSLGARQDVIGLDVKLGEKPATVVGVMPEGFGYPFNYHAWSPLQLRASYGALKGDAISVIGRLAPGVTRAQANAELRVLSEQTAAALPATHEHLRSRVLPPGEPGDSDSLEVSDIAQFAISNLPVLLVLMIACMSVGTLFYARTATRDGEIALRSALGATRGRIIFQLFVEALVLAVLAACVGLFAADQILRWGTTSAYVDEGGLPFWINPGLALTTILYAGGLAIVCAVMVSLLPALRATREHMQSHLANMGTGGATLRFGRLWTGAMIALVALTAIGIPVAMEGAHQVVRTGRVRAQFPTREYLAARIDVDPPVVEQAASALEERRARLFTELERRLSQEPGVAAVTFANRAPGSGLRGRRVADVELSPGTGPAFDFGIWTISVGPGFFETFDRPILAGRGFNGGDWNPTAGVVIVNEAFVRGFRLRGGESPIGARLRYSDRSATSSAQPSAAAASADTWLEIVGVVRDIGLDPDDDGNEVPQVFQPTSAGTVSPLVMSVRTRVNPATLVARLPVIAADINPVWSVQDARPLEQWQDDQAIVFTTALVTVNTVVLFLSALGIFSLLSVSVSRQTREIGLRMALGEDPRHLLGGILSRAIVLMGSGIAIGACVLLIFVMALDADDLAKFAGWLVVTAAVMLGTGLLASIEPARRALSINPIDALRQTT